MNNSVFEKTIENVIKQRDIKLVTTDKKRNQLVPEPKYHNQCLKLIIMRQNGCEMVFYQQN